jgi:hypothetical protein
MSKQSSLKKHFAAKDPIVAEIYARLLDAVREFGEIKEEAHLTSIHLVNKSALAGVATRKNYLLLEFKTNYAIKNARVDKSEQLSRNRFHHRVKLATPDAIDAQVLKWLKDAYDLSG